MPRKIGLRIAASIGLALGLAVLLLLGAFAMGWVDFDSHVSNAEIGLGVLGAALTAIGTGAIAQGISTFELGPEVLVGPLVALAVLVALTLALGQRSTSTVLSGGFVILVGQVKLGVVATRMTWTLRS